MTPPKHLTPGEWTLSPSSAIIHNGTDTHVAEIVWPGSGPCSPDPVECEANARLLAQAKRLAEALDRILVCADQPVPPIVTLTVAKWRQEMMQAIADDARAALLAAGYTEDAP